MTLSHDFNDCAGDAGRKTWVIRRVGQPANLGVGTRFVRGACSTFGRDDHRVSTGTGGAPVFPRAA
ncbi:MAG: hypothetical protein HY827_01830 [Actinobacteria bacterium]|nr:hypothetical protein [Actinomycetota bacterium]